MADVNVTTEVKAGLFTTEFWLTLPNIIVGLALVLLGAFKGMPNLLETGMIMLLGGSGIYGATRAVTKYGATPTTVVLPPAPAPATATDAATLVGNLPPASR